ncbi:hypothetical protein BG011_007827 [Mortierella polycephala]|uniref:Uncharacterized protein n=1 Tax=Mortierella polycephala TaxID=41804 RepID=A0A9P6PP84_9FUNG|nr:hypothetical protein BG011_007827 [Mortierella polycephala]
MPTAPAIKITSHATDDNSTFPNAYHASTKVAGNRGARFADDTISDRDMDLDQGGNTLHAPTSSSNNINNNNNDNSRDNNGNSGNAVKFQTRPRGLTGDSTNSEIYPTFATYRQAQHANFDAFAQRIRRVLETANAQNRREQLEQEERLRLQQQQGGEAQDESCITGVESSSTDQTSKPLSALSAAHTRQLLDAETSSTHSGTLSVSRAAGVGGRPRSSSTASMISNLSEKLRLGSSFFGRAGNRSRAGSNASEHPVPPHSVGITGTANPNASGPSPLSSSSTAPTPPALSEPPISTSSTIAMADTASAAAIASTMTLPQPVLSSSGSDEAIVDTKRTAAVPRRSSRHSALMHPLKETSRTEDDMSERYDATEQPGGQEGSHQDNQTSMQGGNEDKGAGHEHVVDHLGIVEGSSTNPEEGSHGHDKCSSIGVQVLTSKPSAN